MARKVTVRVVEIRRQKITTVTRPPSVPTRRPPAEPQRGLKKKEGA
jgi:hypothetical protein